MPHLEIRTANGQSYRCAAFTPETAARWLYETVAALADPNLAWGCLDIRMEPMFLGSGADPKPDWSANSVRAQYHRMDFKDASTSYQKAWVLISKLQELAEEFRDE